MKCSERAHFKAYLYRECFMVCKDQRDDQQSLMVRYQAEALIKY